MVGAVSPTPAERRAQLARYRRRMELHIQAAAIRRSSPVPLSPALTEAAWAVIQAFGRIEADGGLWLSVAEGAELETTDLEAVLVELEAAGYLRGTESALIRRFVLALEPRQAWRWKLVDRELAQRWELAEVAAFRWLVESGGGGESE